MRRTLAIPCGLALLLCLLTCGGLLLLNPDRLSKGSGPIAILSGETTATKPVEKSNLRMDVLLLELYGKKDSLSLYILAENTSDTRIVNFVENVNRPAKAYEMKLTDEFGNKYHRPTTLNHPTLRLGLVGLRPKEFVIFMLPAFQPVDKAKRLSLELSSLRACQEIAFTHAISWHNL